MTTSAKFTNPSIPYYYSSQRHAQENGRKQFQCFSTKTIHPLSSLFRRGGSRRRRSRSFKIHHPLSSPTSDPNNGSDKFQIILDIQELKTQASDSLRNTINSCESKVDEILTSGIEAYRDLRNLVSVDSRSNRIVISCRESTVSFLGGMVLWSFVVVIVFRGFIQLASGLSRMRKGEGVQVVRRRDRSLGGKEVVVGIGSRATSKSSADTRRGEYDSLTALGGNYTARRRERELPNWWPMQVSNPVPAAHREEDQRDANRLVRAILDARLRGEDISEADILKLRRICRKSGVRVFIETANVRDSFYRTAIEFVINACCRVGSGQIDGEDARVFIAGLADNIGLPSIRAATIVYAVVAARTRLWFLQAWALEMQHKHSEAVVELSKLCIIHQIFPPEPGSPEMEMVAQGLEKHLKLEQREFLLNSMLGLCREECLATAAEALGLIYTTLTMLLWVFLFDNVAVGGYFREERHYLKDMERCLYCSSGQIGQQILNVNTLLIV